MTSYLVGFSYHYPEDAKAWNDGVIEDFEASTGIYIEAPSAESALEWGEVVARRLHAEENPDAPDSWGEFSHHCWIEEEPENSGWEHCLEFFQQVDHGEMPRLAEMNSTAYCRWLAARNRTG